MLFTCYSFEVCRVCSVHLVSFQILVIQVFSLFTLLLLLKVCQFYWFFQKYSSFFHRFFSKSCFLVFNFTDSYSRLYYFFPSFPLGLFCSFSRLLRWELRFFIWDFPSLNTVSTINLPLSTALAISNKFWCVMLSFSLSPMYSLISL